MNLRFLRFDSLPHGLDRVGVIASVGCAVHCLAAPLLVLVTPLLGGIWVHPATHIAIAFLVVPVAILSLSRGAAIHGQRWCVGIGLVGIVLVLLGAVWPFVPAAYNAAETEYSTRHECCPSVHLDQQTGEWLFRFPPATWITMAGGAALVFAHVRNLRCCARACRGVAGHS